MDHNIYQGDETVVCLGCTMEVDVPSDNPIFLYYVYREFHRVECSRSIDVDTFRGSGAGTPPSGAAEQVADTIQLSSDVTAKDVQRAIDLADRRSHQI